MKKFSLLLIVSAAFLLLTGTCSQAQYWYRPGYHPVPGYYPPLAFTTVRVYPAYGYSVARDVQFSLKRRGYYRGPVDGMIGPASREAIRAWQYNHRLPVNGMIDRPLLRSLGL
ncbi:MAG: peptidoglycan-binding domain-containing protein [Verrucomicrobiota bacterium]